jgi:hypothetical protein
MKSGDIKIETAPQHTMFALHFIENPASLSLNSHQNDNPYGHRSDCMDKPEETHRSVGVKERTRRRDAFLLTYQKPSTQPQHLKNPVQPRKFRNISYYPDFT